MTKHDCKVYIIYFLALSLLRLLNYESMIVSALSIIITLLIKIENNKN